MKTILLPIRAARLLAGMRLRDAALIAGCSINFMSLCERGKRRLRPDVEAKLFEIYTIQEVRK